MINIESYKMKKTILALSLTAIFSSSVMAETTTTKSIDFTSNVPSLNSMPDIDGGEGSLLPPVLPPLNPKPSIGDNMEIQPEHPTSPGIDNSLPAIPTQPPVDNTPDRPTPDHSPDWGINPDKPVDRPEPQVPVQPPVDNTPERPTPDHSPDWGINPDKPVDRPQPDDASPDYGKEIPTQPPVDNSPDRPQPQEPTQPPVDDNSPERPTPDFGDTPDWGIPHATDGERITALENDFKAMAEENNRRFNEQDEKIDGVRAGLHAVANARPFVTSGEFAIGAGVGFSGSKEALALGGAYGINEQLSVSGTFHYESSGSYSSSDVAGGVGVQYSFK